MSTNQDKHLLILLVAFAMNKRPEKEHAFIIKETITPPKSYLLPLNFLVPIIASSTSRGFVPGKLMRSLVGGLNDTMEHATQHIAATYQITSRTSKTISNLSREEKLILLVLLAETQRSVNRDTPPKRLQYCQGRERARLW